MVPERANILGVGVSAINMDMALETIDGWCRSREAQYVCVRDAHGVILSQRDKMLRQIHNSAGLVTPDGMPLVWLLKLAGYYYADRVYGPDLMQAVLGTSCEAGYSHFLYGGTEAVLAKLRRNLEHKFPGIRIVGSYAPPFRSLTPDEDLETVRQINASGADICWVGLSTPKQEYWMATHRGKLSPPVLIGVGAAFDFLSGTKQQAPRFIQRSGFEWLYRLATEPRRLWKRYMHTVPLFAFLVLCQKLRFKRYSLDA